jgi:hypothetical protein
LAGYEKELALFREMAGFFVDYSEITFLEEIGSGYYSTVWKAVYRGHTVAVKQLNKREYVQSFVRELFGLWYEFS